MKLGEGYSKQKKGDLENLGSKLQNMSEVLHTKFEFYSLVFCCHVGIACREGRKGPGQKGPVGILLPKSNLQNVNCKGDKKKDWFLVLKIHMGT
jgi:hypothetical protein